MKDGLNAAPLRLTIDTDRPVRARDAARIIDTLNLAFSFGPRRSQPFSTEHMELRLVSLHCGSLLADLMGFAGGFVTLSEFHQAAVKLIQALIRGLRMMAGKAELDLSQPDADALAALCAPVAHDHARQVTLQIVGDNANVLVIDAAAATIIQTYMTAGNAAIRREEGKPETHRWLAAEESLVGNLRTFNRSAKKGVRGVAVKKGQNWWVHWPIHHETIWPMRLVISKDLRSTLIDEAEYVFIGHAKNDPKLGLTFTAQSTEYWDDTPLS